MRADYATSDLISKVNSDWINEVLAHREFRRADPAEDVARSDVADDAPADAVDASTADDLRLRREFARKRAILLQRGATGSGRHEPDIAIDPTPRYRPRSVARRIKEQILRTTGLTGSVGVAGNKFLAKLASDMNKPDGLTVIRPEEAESILAPLPVGRIWGIGPKTADRLQGLGIKLLFAAWGGPKGAPLVFRWRVRCL